MILLSDVTDDPERKITLLEAFKVHAGDSFGRRRARHRRSLSTVKRACLRLCPFETGVLSLFEGFLAGPWMSLKRAMGTTTRRSHAREDSFLPHPAGDEGVQESSRGGHEGRTPPPERCMPSRSRFKLFGAGRRAYDALWAAVDADPEVRSTSWATSTSLRTMRTTIS